MKHLNIRDLPAKLSNAISQTYREGDRIILVRRGRAVAALVPIADLEALESWENQIDVREARKALADLKAGRVKAIPWTEAARWLEQHKAPRRPKGRKTV